MTDILDAMIAAADAESVALASGKPHSAACACDAEMEERSVTQTVPYGEDGESFVVQVPVVFCQSCRRGYTDQRAERLRHEAYCRQLGLLMPEEIAEVRIALSMTRERFEEVYGLPVGAMAKWEAGLLVQGKAADDVLRALRDLRIGNAAASSAAAELGIKRNPRVAAAEARLA